MDVTFFEDKSFYPKSDIQGENPSHKYQIWPQTLSNSMPSNCTPNPKSEHNHIPSITVVALDHNVQ